MKINTDAVRKKLVKFLKGEFRKRGFKKCVIGISGGIDSALVATLAVEALGAGNVFGLFLPYGESRFDMKDAQDLAARLGISLKVIDISPMIDTYFKNFPKADKVRRGNKMARERMSILFDHSKFLDALVIGSGNKTETLVGYFTLHGDAAWAVNPLAPLYKTQVRQLARALKVPQAIIYKHPSAGLWPGQTDEGEMGLTYDELDKILYYLVDKKMNREKLLKIGFKKETVDRAAVLIKNSHFKRMAPAVAKL